MCGFCGIPFPPKLSTWCRHPGAKGWRNRFGQERGPDGPENGSNTTLGTHWHFERLAIVDLSELGHQPMVSANGVRSEP